MIRLSKTFAFNPDQVSFLYIARYNQPATAGDTLESWEKFIQHKDREVEGRYIEELDDPEGCDCYIQLGIGNQIFKFWLPEEKAQKLEAKLQIEEL
ncbi:MAG: hypothetical protein F6K54_16265 [Okeania sp. SIO3B5]|uniref:hypothetical protein n=1 Tax=Okeania sp. SIO3B5 TaxID=2607811 RepID=UPI0014008135|nr:hypothetical protein [Okeania sp. SIO3B5]NEO54498.1 hypothetical protein [Okeania sp. SIO3B5]